MKTSLLATLTLAAASLTATQAKAELVTYDFTATLTSFNNNDGLLNSDMSAGEGITGSFTIDEDVDGEWYFGATRYRGALVDWEYQLADDVLTGQGGNVLINNSYFDDVISATGTSSNASLQINGTEFDGDFAAEVAFLFDDDADMIDDEALPDFAALSLSDIDLAATGAGLDTRAGFFVGDVALFSADLTSITLAGGSVQSAPELDPASLGSAGALVASAATVVRSRRRSA